MFLLNLYRNVLCEGLYHIFKHTSTSVRVSVVPCVAPHARNHSTHHHTIKIIPMKDACIVIVECGEDVVPHMVGIVDSEAE